MKARLWKPLEDEKTQCALCAHHCVLAHGTQGLCGVRYNTHGEMHTLVGDVVAAVNLDPVEKKPLYHFHPNSKTYSFGAPGCNFACRFCQNHAISRPPADGGGVRGKRTTSQILLQEAERLNAQSISFTYTEPTVFFELMYDTAGLAQAHGFDCIMVSNGFQSQDCLSELYHRIHAANIDLKSFRQEFYTKYCKARLDTVLDNLVTIASLGWWLEITTLLIPGVNDSPEELRDIARFIYDALGPQVPWHVSRFHGAYQMAHHPATSPASLERAWHIGKEEGLHYVYTGNVGAGMGVTTFCPVCHAACVTRQGFTSTVMLAGDACPQCGQRIHGVWSTT